MKILDRFDSWVQQGPFTALDLAIYRIIYVIAVLAIAPDLEWLAGYPEWMYRAPLGPLQLISAFPSETTLIALELLRTLALVLLAVGLWTRWASIAVGLILFITFGLNYSLGKVDHTILLVLIPVVLAFSNWGDRLSVDAIRSASRHPQTTPQWPLRFLALLIGLSFSEAALVKLGTGWLDLSSQAVRGHFRETFISIRPDTWLSSWAFEFSFAPAWELLDWMTVALEFSLLLTVPWWRAFRITLAFATIFHLGVLLIMNIPFSQNLIAYGAFVAWGLIAALGSASSDADDPHGGSQDSPPKSRPKGAVLGSAVGAVCLLTLTFWSLTSYAEGIRDYARDTIVFVGAVIGAVYLANQTVYFGRRLALFRTTGDESSPSREETSAQGH